MASKLALLLTGSRLSLRRWLTVVLVLAAAVCVLFAAGKSRADESARTADAAQVPTLSTATSETQPATSLATTSVSVSPEPVAAETPAPAPPATTDAATPQPVVDTTQGIIPTFLEIPALYDGAKKTVAPAPSVMAFDEFVGHDVPSFGVPPDSDMETTTWWSADINGNSTPRPGDPELAVILGHTQIGAYGVFNDLANLRAGDDIYVGDGMVTKHFQVQGDVHTGLPKSDPTVLNQLLEDNRFTAGLALVTCSGHFNGTESVENTVVLATLVG